MHRRLHLNSEVRPIGNSSPQLTIQWAVDLIHHRSKCQFKHHILPKLSVFQQDMGHSENGYATTNYTYYLYDFKCRSNVKMRAFSLWASLDTYISRN